MSQCGGPSKRRCIVKTLDFENCVVTDMKTRSRSKRKVRAKWTREINYDKTPDKGKNPVKAPLSNSPVLTQSIRFVPVEETSPVLIRKPYHNRSDSPVLLNRRKLNFADEKVQESSVESTSRYSPVFKIQTQKQDQTKVELTKNETVNPSKSAENLLERLDSVEIFISQVSSTDTDKVPDGSYQIEECTTQESKTVGISSVESLQMKKSSSGDYSVEMKTDSEKWPSEEYSGCTWPDMYEGNKVEVEPNRRTRKKNSLLKRLEKLLRKQASDKLLWQHQNPRRYPGNHKKLCVITTWKEGPLFIIKCDDLLPGKNSSKRLYLLVDNRWVPNVNKVKNGSVLQVYPPWQELTIGPSESTILIDVICLEILDETITPVLDKVTYESVPVECFRPDPKEFIDSLFSSNISGLLY